MARSSQLNNLASLLARGIRVALIHGDSDYIANWMGGEAVSLALAKEPWPAAQGHHPEYQSSPYGTAFAEAGYADVIVNDTYIGGVVRQFGNLSFTRVYDSGHLVPAYQPETAFALFTRIIHGLDIATGQHVDLGSCSSHGPPNSTHDNSATFDSSSPGASPTCWIRDIEDTCTPEQIAAMTNDEGFVRSGVWYAGPGEYKPPPNTTVAGLPGNPASGNFGGPRGSMGVQTSKESTVTASIFGTRNEMQPTELFVSTAASKSQV